ncbi:MAG TPA: TetR family transcriptional regulator [Spirochaetes bacterium]|nr:TetR family transcriptional regulator [Spirochaetota bacterium]
MTLIVDQSTINIQVLFMVNKETKKALIEKGAEIIYLKGFNNTGINEILEAASVPKGSFYYYFKNKEDFGIQLIDHFLVRFLSGADRRLSVTKSSYIERLRVFFDDFLEFFKGNGFKGGCPIANFSLEMSDLNENIRKRLDTAFDQMNNKIALFLEGAVKNGELPEDLDTGLVSNFILNSWEGALLRIKLTRDVYPMKLFYNFVFQDLLNFN